MIMIQFEDDWEEPDDSKYLQQHWSQACYRVSRDF